jgi:PAS domain S-box-containing protein
MAVLLTTLNECVIAFDVDKQKFLFISPNVGSVLGYAADSFYHNSNLTYEMIDPADRGRVKTTSDKIVEGEAVELTYRIVTAHGEKKWVHEKKSVITDEQTGHKILMSLINEHHLEAGDIAQISKIVEQVTWTRDHLEVLFNNTDELIWAINRDRHYLYMNNAFREIIFAETETVPKDGDHVYLNTNFSQKKIEEWEAFYTRAFKGERFTARTESVDVETGQSVCFEVSFNPLCKSKGKVTAIGCFARNITGLVENEKAITDQNERLRHIASISSHELRRPIASLLGLINIMDRENFQNPENKEIIEHLLTVGKEIDETIRDIIDRTFPGGDPSDQKYQSP